MSKFTLSLLCAIAASLTVVSAVTKEEFTAFRVAIAPIVAECAMEHQVSRNEIEVAKQNKDASGIASCFIACVLKKTELLDNNGFYDGPTGLAKLRTFIKSDEEFHMYEKVANKCKTVNNEPVTDGATGCDRAQLLLNCALEHIDEMPLLSEE